MNWNLGTGTFYVGNTIDALNDAGPNTFPDVSGTFISLGYNIIGNGFNGFGFGAVGDQVGTVASPIDPKIGVLANNGGPTQTDALLAGSPAINAGNPALGLPTDQRGIVRPQGAAPDIGAYERQIPIIIKLNAAVVIPSLNDGRSVCINATGRISDLGPFGTVTFTITDSAGNIVSRGTLDADERGNFHILELVPAVHDDESLDQSLTLTILASNPDESASLSIELTRPGNDRPQPQ